MAKAFSWDSEKVIVIKVIEDGKQRRVVKICTLKGIEYISITKEAQLKDGWKPVGGWAEKLTTYKEIYTAFEDWQLVDAFGSGGVANIQKAIKPTKKVTK